MRKGGARVGEEASRVGLTPAREEMPYWDEVFVVAFET